jgi:hypothetical protein
MTKQQFEKTMRGFINILEKQRYHANHGVAMLNGIADVLDESMVRALVEEEIRGLRKKADALESTLPSITSKLIELNDCLENQMEEYDKA